MLPNSLSDASISLMLKLDNDITRKLQTDVFQKQMQSQNFSKSSPY